MQHFDVFHPQEALKSEASVTIRGRTLGTNLQLCYRCTYTLPLAYL